MNPEDPFETAVWNLLDGNLSEVEFKKLESTLLQSDEERARFLELADLHGLLHQKLGHHASDPSVVSMDVVIQRQQLRILKRSALAAAALVLIAGLVMSVVWLKQSAPVLTFRHTEDALFQVSHSDQEGADENELAIGSRLQLSQGTIELSLKNGVQAIVRAPADFILSDRDRLDQNQGIIHYLVPQSAIGFQVQTPELLVTDLGTEFGVVSHPEEADQVHLFKGKVEIESRKHLKTKELLTGIESRIIGPMGHFKTITPTPGLFKTSLEEKLPYLHLSFDQLEGEQLEVDGDLSGLDQISALLKKGRGESKLAPGKFGEGLQLDGQGGYVQTNWPGIPGAAPRTVAFWCQLPESEAPDDSKGLVAWGDVRVFGHKFVIVTNQDSSAGQTGAIRYDCGRGYTIGETNIADGKWHHVAVVMGGEKDASAGTQVQIYVDGQKEMSTRSRANEPETSLGIDDKTWMSLGRYNRHGLQDYRFLTGSLDELYVFPGILTQADVRQLMNGDWD